MFSRAGWQTFDHGGTPADPINIIEDPRKVRETNRNPSSKWTGSIEAQISCDFDFNVGCCDVQTVSRAQRTPIMGG